MFALIPYDSNPGGIYTRRRNRQGVKGPPTSRTLFRLQPPPPNMTCSLLELASLCVVSVIHCWSDCDPTQQILEHMDESGVYNESDLAPFHRRLAELRCVLPPLFLSRIPLSPGHGEGHSGMLCRRGTAVAGRTKTHDTCKPRLVASAQTVFSNGVGPYPRHVMHRGSPLTAYIQRDREERC